MSTNAVESVKVRMYRHGFGDCFLLSFLHGQERVFSIVVDCGIKHNTRSEKVPIELVIADLEQTLKPTAGGKPRIDVLVATHEHWDHVAFFHPTASKKDFFRAFAIDQIWLAWTEDPEDDEAVKINSRLREGAAALKLATAHLNGVAKAQVKQFGDFGVGPSIAQARTAFNSELNNVLGFYGVAVAKNTKTSKSGIKYKAKGKISVETEVAMKNVIKLGKKGGIAYLNPGTKIERRLPPGINVYVLGPPRSTLINKMNPSKGPAKETYLGIDHTGLSGFIDGVFQLGAPPKAKVKMESDGPFGKSPRLTPRQAKADPYLRDTYFAHRESYRQIEHTWLDAIGQFALQLDGAINNTSLVIAIELENSGKVLLFPGDAQVGSWLSWHEHQWDVKRGDRTETVNAEHLLRNTVLYKVSHHGSHNATVKDKGLELMTHPDLVAMIPEKEKSYNGILYKPLIDHLRKRCKGRVLISADVAFPPENLLKKRPSELSAKEWESFNADLKVEPLYVEYTVR